MSQLPRRARQRAAWPPFVGGPSVPAVFRFGRFPGPRSTRLPLLPAKPRSGPVNAPFNARYPAEPQRKIGFNYTGDESPFYSLGRKNAALTFISGNESGRSTSGKNAFSPLFRLNGLFEGGTGRYAKDRSRPNARKRGRKGRRKRKWRSSYWVADRLQLYGQAVEKVETRSYGRSDQRNLQANGAGTRGKRPAGDGFGGFKERGKCNLLSNQ